MIRHIVLFNVKEGEDKDQVAAIAAKVLEPLVGQIPGLLKMEILFFSGRMIRQSDLCHFLPFPAKQREASADF